MTTKQINVALSATTHARLKAEAGKRNVALRDLYEIALSEWLAQRGHQ